MSLRLVADDLTGALDSAVQFCGTLGPLPVRFAPGAAGDAAFDMATRDRPAAEATERVAAFASDLIGGDPAFHKIDSLLRGHWPLELQAAMDAGFRSCILAPAFPGQGRITREGRQWAPDACGALRPIEPPIAERLAEAGLAVIRHAAPADIRGETGIHLFDAANDGELAAVIRASAVLPPPLLWCGSAGLAAALAGRPPPRITTLPSPVLAIVGSHAPASRAQVAALRDACTSLRRHALGADARLPADWPGEAGLLTFDLPPGLDEAAAAAAIAARLASVLPQIAAPATLVAAGGETLRRICELLGTGHLTVAGEFAVGMPVSTMAGGRWDGTRVVSRSGAFGSAAALVEIFEACGLEAPPRALRRERGQRQ